ncbi:hypothetical protein GWN42_25940, partial [candidate division KSB1 bacterium]|nr:hypothetical protein [candidate division KSB1 bacterium]
KGIAGGGVGTPVSDIDALQKTLAVDEVFVFAATGEVGWGKAKYPNVTIPEKSNVIFDYDNGTLEITTISEGFSATK